MGLDTVKGRVGRSPGTRYITAGTTGRVVRSSTGTVRRISSSLRRFSSSPATLVVCCGIVFCALCVCDFLATAPPLPSPAGAKSTPALKTTLPDNDGCWVFTHLQKSGGTTVKSLLFGRWAGSKSTTYDSFQWKHGGAYTESVAASLASEAGLSVAAGGYSEALRSTAAFDGGADSQCRWFTVFRHPVPRMVSAYFYCKRDPSDQLCASGFASSETVDLATFASHWGNFAVRQFALSLVSFDEVTSYLQSSDGGSLTEDELIMMPGWYMLKLFLDGGTRDTLDDEHGEVPEGAMLEMLGPVQDLLRDRYAVIGILEEFDTTLSLFDAVLGMPGMDWHEEFDRAGEKNVNPAFGGKHQEALEEAWTNSEITRHMRLDLLLYEHAVDVFHRQVELYGLS